MKRLIKRILPARLFRLAQPAYHYLLALGGALWYRFPSRELFVVGVTGTKGKSSTAELVNAILEAAGHRTALLSTIRFKISDTSEPNLLKMTMPGRFFVHRFLRNALTAGCTHAVIEMTSEGVKQFRHKFIALDTLIFTNLSPEHIESHGSFENYLAAKLKLATALSLSSKPHKVMVANTDDEYGARFLETAYNADPVPFSSGMIPCRQTSQGLTMTYGAHEIHSRLEGAFNCINIIAAIAFAESQSIPADTIRAGIERVTEIPGRVQHINVGQSFDVVVDYAHTPDSLLKLYQTFAGKEKICVLGNTGGGRDTWKRPEMGRIADELCRTVILTNEDPYDEDPEKIMAEMAAGMKQPPRIIMDRREAIREALGEARALENVVVLISGKGTDPFIMGKSGTKTPWSDAEVVREELRALNKAGA